MNKIDDILIRVYGNTKAAQTALGVGRTSISNWRTWGHFPRSKALVIAIDAHDAGVPLELREIPIDAPMVRQGVA